VKGFNELSDTEEEALMRGPFGTELVNVIQPCVAPLYWQKAGSSDAASSGSAFFVNTGKALFGITAGHVYDAFAEEASLDPGKVCWFYNFPIADLRSRLISKGRECDVATFEILPSEISRLDRRAAPWPPSIPPKGKSVLLAGFPGIGKRMTASGALTFGMFKSMTNVDSLSERDISLVRPPDDQVTDVDGKGLPPHDIDLGGMSGGPLFTVLDGAGIVSWALAGVIYEYGAAFEIIKAVKADVIGEDGSING
jgi:hypothetical protein